MMPQPLSYLTVSSHRGFTLLELLLALSVCSMVGLTVLMMLNAMVVGTHDQLDTRHHTTRRQVATARMGAATRNAALILARGDHHLVLWKGDARQNGLPELSELRRIEWNVPQSEVLSYDAPASPDPALDQTFDFDDDFSAITAAAAGSAGFPGRVLLQDVTGWEMALDDDDVQSTRLMRLRITLGTERGDDVATIVSALRVPPA